VTNPATVTMSIGLLADAPLSWFLHRHLDNFIVTWQIRTIYRDSVIWTTLSWHGNPAHLPGLCKNTCQPRHRRQLPIPPGRYEKCRGGSESRKLGNFSGLSLWIEEWIVADPPGTNKEEIGWKRGEMCKSFCCSGVKACFRLRAKTKAFTSYRK